MGAPSLGPEASAHRAEFFGACVPHQTDLQLLKLASQTVYVLAPALREREGQSVRWSDLGLQDQHVVGSNVGSGLQPWACYLNETGLKEVSFIHSTMVH